MVDRTSTSTRIAPSSCSDESWKALFSATSGTHDIRALEEAYKEWSKTYDQDNENMTWNGPLQAVTKLSQLMPDRNRRILDVACGTGLVGKELHTHGYVDVDGVDLVKDMLTHAERTGAYSKLEVCDVMERGLPFPDDSYEAITCIGALNQGNITQAIFPELCRVARKGCLIIIIMRESFVYTCKDFMDGQLDTAIISLAQNRTWKYIIREQVPSFLGELMGVMYVMQVQ